MSSTKLPYSSDSGFITNANVKARNLLIDGSIVSKTNPQVGSRAVAGEPTSSYGGTLAVFVNGDFSVGALTDVQAGWTVTDGQGFTATILSVGDPFYGAIKTTGLNWPTSGGRTYTFTSSDYAATSYNNVVLTSGPENWTFDHNGILTLPLTIDSSTTKEIKYGLGNLAVQLDGGWVIGEYNGTAWGTEGIRISPGIEGAAEVNIPSNDTANVNSLSVNNYAGNVVVTSGDNIGNNYQWKFDSNGALNLPTAAGPSSAGWIQTANDFPTLLAYGSNGHGGPELDWMNADDPANTFGNTTTLRHTMYLNDDEGLYVGFNENNTANIYTGHLTFSPVDGQFSLPANLSVAGNIIGAYLWGDGSNISNITATANTGNFVFDSYDLDGTAFDEIALGGTNSGNILINAPGLVTVVGGYESDGMTAGNGNVYIFNNDPTFVDGIPQPGVGQTWQFDNTGNLQLPGGTKISGTSNHLYVDTLRSSTLNSYSKDTTQVLYYNPDTKEVTTAPANNIVGDPFAAATTGTNDVTVWTASSADVVGAKLIVRVVYYNGTWINTEMLEVMIAKNYPDGTPSFTVTNRVKTNPAYDNVLINVALDGSNRLQLTSSAPSGDGHTIYWTYTATSFNQTFD